MAGGRVGEGSVLLLFDADFTAVLTGTATQAIAFTVVIAVATAVVPVDFTYLCAVLSGLRSIVADRHGQEMIWRTW